MHPGQHGRDALCGLIKVLSNAAGGPGTPGTIVIMVVFGVIYGSLVGASQSFCRSMFSLLVPKGHESEFFSFFEISDRGSSWLGPTVAALCSILAGEALYVTIYIGVVLFLSIWLICGVELKREEAVENPEDLRREHAEEREQLSRRQSASVSQRKESTEDVQATATEPVQMDVQAPVTVVD